MAFPFVLEKTKKEVVGRFYVTVDVLFGENQENECFIVERLCAFTNSGSSVLPAALTGLEMLTFCRMLCTGRSRDGRVNENRCDDQAGSS
jgi:hypothetical protein